MQNGLSWRTTFWGILAAAAEGVKTTHAGTTIGHIAEVVLMISLMMTGVSAKDSVVR